MSAERTIQELTDIWQRMENPTVAEDYGLSISIKEMQRLGVLEEVYPDLCISVESFRNERGVG